MKLDSEKTEQIRVVNFCEEHNIPIFHVPNGFKASRGQRLTLYKMGLRSGVPDLFIPVPAKKFAGLFIEMKRKTGSKTTTAQKNWQKKLTELGYKASICKGAEIAISEIIKYFE